MPKRLIIIGSGGYGRTVLDIAKQLGFNPIIILDDKSPGYELSAFSSYIDEHTMFIVAVGNNSFRLSWCEKIIAEGGKLATLIHPTAYISSSATVMGGSVILPKAVVNTNTSIKRGCIINLGAIIDHDCVIEDGVHICLGAIVKGENRIKSCTKIEAGDIVELRKYPV